MELEGDNDMRRVYVHCMSRVMHEMLLNRGWSYCMDVGSVKHIVVGRG